MVGAERFVDFHPLGYGSGQKHNSYSMLYVIQGVTGGMCETSGECSLGQTIPI